METALALQDDVVGLLIALGAKVDFSVGAVDHWAPQNTQRLNLPEWINSVIQSVSRVLQARPASPSIEKEDRKETETPPPAGWLTCLADLLSEMTGRTLNDWWTARQDELFGREKAQLGLLMDYLTDVARRLSECGVKVRSQPLPSSSASPVTFDSDEGAFSTSAGDTLDGPDDDTDPRAKYLRLIAPRSRYNYYGSSSPSEDVPKYLATSYDVLFEACFAGSNEHIQQMFIPGAVPTTTIDTSLFYISVQVAAPKQYSYARTGSFIRRLSCYHLIQFSVIGITPLVAAIAGRHWDTARLIMTIAGLQFKPVEQPMRFSTVGIRLGTLLLSVPFQTDIFSG